MRCGECGAWAEEGAATCPSCGAPLTAEESSEASASAQGLVRTAYAGFWLRLTAYAIDALILSAATLIIMVPLAPLFFGTTPPQPPMPGEALKPAVMMFVSIVYGLAFLGSWLYFALFESSAWQATPGKRVLGLFVTDMHGGNISFGRATARFFGRILSTLILLVGYFMIGFTEKKQGLHDMLADCLVLRRI